MMKYDMDDSSLLTKTELEIRIHNDNEQVNFSFQSKSSEKSKVWDNFEVIIYKDIVQNFARCKRCQMILSYKSKTGTASLLRHRCSKSGCVNQSTIESRTKKLLQHVKKDLAYRQLQLYGNYMKTDNNVEGEGLDKLPQSLMFSIQDDLTILREMVSKNQKDDERCRDIHKSLNEQNDKNYAENTIKERVDHLTKLWGMPNNEELYKEREMYSSGAETYDAEYIQNETVKTDADYNKADAHDESPQILNSNEMKLDQEDEAYPINNEIKLEIDDEDETEPANDNNHSPVNEIDPPDSPNATTLIKDRGKKRLVQRAMCALSYLTERNATNLTIQKKQLELEERRICLEEKRLKLEIEKFNLEKYEREHRLAIDIKEREQACESLKELINILLNDSLKY